MRFRPFNLAVLCLSVALIAAMNLPANAHCQVPCGIYDDHARVHGMLEDVTTIRKAVDKLSALAGKTDAQSVNQRVRWVAAKDAHAERIIRVISDYFLTQRVKPKSPKDRDHATYIKMLTEHHAVMVAAMKAKQKTDAATVDALAEKVKRLEKWWPPAKRR